MRAINKQKEPVALTEYRLKVDAVYDGDSSFTPVKDKIRQSLLAEQGFLCAYCMQRIRADIMKIEHWQCQTQYPGVQLDYRNLLGVCNGNEGRSPESQTCDTRKGNADLTYNPANPAHRMEERVRYLGNGRLESTEPEFTQQIDRVLNLNYARLVGNRKAVLGSVLEVLGSKEGLRTASEIQKILHSWTVPDINGCLRPYNGVAIYFLRKRLGKVS